MEPPMIGFPGDPGQKAWRRQKRCCCITSKADCKMVGGCRLYKSVVL